MVYILTIAQSVRQNPVGGWILIMRSLNWISAKSLMSAVYE